MDETDDFYYHFIKTEYLFKSTIIKCNVPLSTTTDLSVGIIYANTNNAPLILGLSKYGQIGGYGLNCQWLTDFVNESECLFMGAHCIQIQSIIHIDKEHNYSTYIHAMSIINNIVCGESIDDDQLISFDYRQAIDLLIEMESATKQEMTTTSKHKHKHKHKRKKIPSYIRSLFHYQCDQRSKIKIDINSLLNMYDDGQCIFMTEDNNWIHLDLLLNIYQNVEEINISCQNKMTMNIDCYKRLLNVLKMLQGFDQEKVQLQCIQFKQPSKSSISLQSVLSSFKDDSLCSLWKIQHVNDTNTIILERKTKNDDQDCLIM